MAAWHELFPLDREPTMEDIAGYIDHPLWDAFTAFVDESYGAKPRIEYSRCGGAPGWNVKYKARGRALCTVYPRDGFFICMVSVGSREKDEAEALLATADPYVRPAVDTVSMRDESVRHAAHSSPNAPATIVAVSMRPLAAIRSRSTGRAARK